MPWRRQGLQRSESGLGVLGSEDRFVSFRPVRPEGVVVIRGAELTKSVSGRLVLLA